MRTTAGNASAGTTLDHTLCFIVLTENASAY